LGIEGAAHMTCVRDSRDEIAALLDYAVASGLENVVALRGDIPPDPAFRRPAGGFTYANELVAFIRRRGYPLCVIGAGHPEGHPECRDPEESIRHLKAKVDAGLDGVITQLFYDNRDYFAFVERARRAGIGVPLVAGIMPITNWPQIERITRLSGNQVPATLRERLERLRDDEAGAMQVGIEWASAQCADLLRQGAPGIHFYTLNRSPATRAIFEQLRRDGLVG
jgi:methylenetetrahydrofolate reductase (NADPH)